ncbi:unnamed protein product [Paramecium primaurelia]|uniref:Alpha-1,4 glucan phosphorylase n=1 Tax=Paramecium primaurelia TaxID=5886 RepID=A0A8S1JRV5_PARPR|nr:unnamed protein product [Paramecium primaurelia]
MIPAPDISQHISTAGKEASSTSNMKFVRSRDGFNIEFSQEVGLNDIYIYLELKLKKSHNQLIQ